MVKMTEAALLNAFKTNVIRLLQKSRVLDFAYALCDKIALESGR